MGVSSERLGTVRGGGEPVTYTSAPTYPSDAEVGAPSAEDSPPEQSSRDGRPDVQPDPVEPHAVRSRPQPAARRLAPRSRPSRRRSGRTCQRRCGSNPFDHSTRPAVLRRLTVSVPGRSMATWPKNWLPPRGDWFG